VLSENDELMYQFLLQMRERRPQTTVAELLTVMCLDIIKKLPDSEHATLANFEPWISEETSRLKWMDTRN
jgi:hypothetical protein